MSYLGIGVLLYSSLWFSYLYFNAEVTDSSGESIKFRDGKLAYHCQLLNVVNLEYLLIERCSKFSDLPVMDGFQAYIPHFNHIAVDSRMAWNLEAIHGRFRSIWGTSSIKGERSCLFHETTNHYNMF